MFPKIPVLTSLSGCTESYLRQNQYVEFTKEPIPSYFFSQPIFSSLNSLSLVLFWLMILRTLCPICYSPIARLMKVMSCPYCHPGYCTSSFPSTHKPCSKRKENAGMFRITCHSARLIQASLGSVGLRAKYCIGKPSS